MLKAFARTRLRWVRADTGSLDCFGVTILRGVFARFLVVCFSFLNLGARDGNNLFCQRGETLEWRGFFRRFGLWHA